MQCVGIIGGCGPWHTPVHMYSLVTINFVFIIIVRNCYHVLRFNSFEFMVTTVLVATAYTGIVTVP